MYILDFIPSYSAFLLQLTKTRILSKIAYLIHTIRTSVSSRYKQIYRIGDSFISIFDSNTTYLVLPLSQSSLRSVQAAIVRYMYIPITLSSTRPSHKPPFFVILLIILIIILLLLLLLLNKYNSPTLQLSNSPNLQLYIFQLSNSPTLQAYQALSSPNSPTLPPTNLPSPILLLYSSYNMQHRQTQQNPT